MVSTEVLKIAGATALFAIALLVIYVLAVLLPKVKNTLQSVQKFVDNDVKKLLAEVNDTVTKLNEEEMPKIDGIITNLKELSEKQISPIMENVQGITANLNEEIPNTIENVNAITKSVQELTETEVKPIASNVQELTAKVNEDIAKITEAITTATEFSKDTVHKAEFYRDKLFTPVIEIVSFWNALKTGFTSLTSAKKGKDKGGEEDA